MTKATSDISTEYRWNCELVEASYQQWLSRSGKRPDDACLALGCSSSQLHVVRRDPAANPGFRLCWRIARVLGISTEDLYVEVQPEA
jgi:DNA-binding XRE family transcriptional regulator